MSAENDRITPEELDGYAPLLEYIASDDWNLSVTDGDMITANALVSIMIAFPRLIAENRRLTSENADLSRRAVTWVPVAERVPKELRRYLYTNSNGEISQGSLFYVCGMAKLGKVLAWAELPEPYKGGGV